MGMAYQNDRLGLHNCDPPPVLDQHILHQEAAINDGCVEGSFCERPELMIDQEGSLGDNQRRGDQWARILLQHGAATGMVRVLAISGGEKRAGVDDQHSIAPEALVEELIGFGCAPPTAGGTDPGER